MRERMPILLVAVLIAGLLLAGCGDDSEGGASASSAGSDGASTTSPTTADKTIAKAEFLSKAKTICEVTVAKITSKAFPVMEKATDKTDAERAELEARLASTVVAPALREEVEGIQALGTPPNDRDQVEAILDAIQEVIDESEERPEAVVSGGGDAFAKSANLAQKYGLPACPYG